MPTALQKAINGEKVSDTAAKGALAQAVDKLKSVSNRAAAMKEKAEVVGTALLHTGEMQTTAFAASFAEGYFGEDKMKLGPVDYRAGAGLAGGAVGLYQLFNGSSAGGHVLAVSNGLLASAVTSFGRRAGAKMAEKKTEAPAAAPAAAPAPAPAAPQVQDFGAAVRDTFLTPEAAADDVSGRRHSRRRPNRFMQLREERDAA